MVVQVGIGKQLLVLLSAATYLSVRQYLLRRKRTGIVKISNGTHVGGMIVASVVSSSHQLRDVHVVRGILIQNDLGLLQPQLYLLVLLQQQVSFPCQICLFLLQVAYFQLKFVALLFKSFLLLHYLLYLLILLS